MAALFFAHEATRVFHDRLIEYTEKGLFYQLLSKEIENYFQVNLYFKNYFKWYFGQKWCFLKVLSHFYNINNNIINVINPIFHLITSKCA